MSVPSSVPPKGSGHSGRDVGCHPRWPGTAVRTELGETRPRNRSFWDTNSPHMVLHDRLFLGYPHPAQLTFSSVVCCCVHIGRPCVCLLADRVAGGAYLGPGGFNTARPAFPEFQIIEPQRRTAPTASPSP